MMKNRAAAADCAIRQVRHSALPEEAEQNCAAPELPTAGRPQKCTVCAIVATSSSTMQALPSQTAHPGFPCSSFTGANLV